MLRRVAGNKVLRRIDHPSSFYHCSARNENSLIFGGLAVAGAAIGLQYGIKIYDSFKNKESPTNVTPSEQLNGQSSEGTETPNATTENKNTTTTVASGGWQTWFARNFYDGGFEAKMTKREAALILGVRESATAERIKDAHRRIMQVNHPDKGGSAFITAKVNEAKDMLLKGK